MKHLKLFAIASLILLPTLSQAADSSVPLSVKLDDKYALSQPANDGYGYPIPEAYGATILGTPDPLKLKVPEQVNHKRLVLDVIPGIVKPDIFYYDEGLRATFAYQDKKAPLIFLIGGTGSNDQSKTLMAMMKTFYQAGFHVVTLPSPTHANFIISASRSHVTGDLTEDSADLYGAMGAVWNKIKKDIEVSDFYLSGYSLGGTQAAFVAKLDEERKVFNFKKVLMINPAVSLYDSINRIEATLDKIPGGPSKAGAFFNSMLAKFTEFYKEGDATGLNDNFLYSVYSTQLFTQEEGGGLIGVTFRLYSAGMIFASDVMTNGGYVVPKNLVLSNSDSLDDYFRVSVHLSFLNYFDEYFYPYFKKERPGLTKDELIAAQSLKSIGSYLMSSPKFGVVTNDNDFILSDDDRGYLKDMFGERLKIYPRGGHLGNLEYKDNMEYMLAFFKQAGDK
jgi:hypothetical protein